MVTSRASLESLAVAMISAPRTPRTVERSIAELRRGGFHQKIFVFQEPETNVAPAPGVEVITNATRLGLWPNWRSAAHAMLQSTDAPFLLICEDDLQLASGAAAALEMAINSLPHHNWGYASLYTSMSNVMGRTVRRGWQAVNRGEYLWGALAYCFTRESLKRVLANTGVRRHHQLDGTDFVVTRAVSELKLHCYFHMPSLVSHTGGHNSTVGHVYMPIQKAVGFSADYHPHPAVETRTEKDLFQRQTSRAGHSEQGPTLQPEVETHVETDVEKPTPVGMNGSEPSPTRIPKILHQIWIGPRQPPWRCLESWRRLHPDWEYRLWRDADIPFPLRTQRQYDAAREFAGKADLIRYEILHRYGGVYADADLFCLRQLPEDLLEAKFFTCYENETARPGLVGNCVLGARPGSPVLESLIDLIQNDEPEKIARSAAWQTTGPLRMTEAIARFAREPQIEILPSRMFLPVHFTDSRPAPERLRGAYAVHLFGSTGPANALDELRSNLLQGYTE